MSNGHVKRLPAAFYALPSGREPVREWLKSLSQADRKVIGEDISDLEFDWPVGMPVCRPLGDGLWEVRSNITLVSRFRSSQAFAATSERTSESKRTPATLRF
jgi:hypothetical protein